ncbi:MAG: hypothetical protein HC769_14895 [Cyanobacteria bacterium CRU_2_1]|nr:hypothetical protein [Cyanobacteria bacterium RU_5_0]NJR60008.1 hypothetical protein [Cyanobacteria bacterium CRU_2_1]
MSRAVLTHTNGSKPDMNGSSWLQQTVEQCFSRFNWDDHPPEIQELKRTVQGSDQPLSFTLTVSQFFSAINWNGKTIAALPQPETPPNSIKPAAFTLEDFSDLF